MIDSESSRDIEAELSVALGQYLGLERPLNLDEPLGSQELDSLDIADLASVLEEIVGDDELDLTVAWQGKADVSMNDLLFVFIQEGGALGRLLQLLGQEAETSDRRKA